VEHLIASSMFTYGGELLIGVAVKHDSRIMLARAGANKM
jgi:hypothetical protein